MTDGVSALTIAIVRQSCRARLDHGVPTRVAVFADVYISILSAFAVGIRTTLGIIFALLALESTPAADWSPKLIPAHDYHLLGQRQQWS
jgi:hypothetical protein